MKLVENPSSSRFSVIFLKNIKNWPKRKRETGKKGSSHCRDSDPRTSFLGGLQSQPWGSFWPLWLVWVPDHSLYIRRRGLGAKNTPGWTDPQIRKTGKKRCLFWTKKVIFLEKWTFRPKTRTAWGQATDIFGSVERDFVPKSTNLWPIFDGVSA